MHIKTLSEIELKALAYEQVVNLQTAQAKIAAINQELSLRAKKVPEVESNG